MLFDQCVDTSSYTGVSFKLAGASAGCDLYFKVATFDEESSISGGGCMYNCFDFPNVKIAMGSDPSVPIVVRFADLAGGMLPGAAAIAMQIVGFEWQLQTDAPPTGGPQQACPGAELVIDDVSFVP
jgi:hypothetical protein